MSSTMTLNMASHTNERRFRRHSQRSGPSHGERGGGRKRLRARRFRRGELHRSLERNGPLGLTGALVLIVVLAALTGCVEEDGDDHGEPTLLFEGATLIARNETRITLRAYTPSPRVTVDDLSGTLTITNCINDARVRGFDGTYRRDGGTFQFDLDGTMTTLFLEPPAHEHFSFAVIGDTQGWNDIYAAAQHEMTNESARSAYRFIIHCGDITPSSSADQFDAVWAVMNETTLPTYLIPGNHDARFGGLARYRSRFGPAQYAFEYSDILFVFLDSSALFLDDEAFQWLEGVCDGSAAARRVLVTHAPFYDPFGGSHTLDNASSERLEETVTARSFELVLSGHIHAYDHTPREESGIELVITGGGGARLVNGTHHFCEVEVDADGGFEPRPVPIAGEEAGAGDDDRDAAVWLTIRHRGINRTVELTAKEIEALPTIAGNSSFQNQFGNVRCKGHYRGVSVATLLGAIGGMDRNETLTVTARDGYAQRFSYNNVYPEENTTFATLQGDMIVAFSFDGETPPTWDEGARVVMLPPDEYYSNDDCAQTSYPGQGYHRYESAGARWVKNTWELTVVGSSGGNSSDATEV